MIRIGDIMLETDLFNPVKKLLETFGYHVKGEVVHTDVFGVKEGQTIAVELKNQISLKLIYQAIERLKIADKVYIGIPKKAILSHRKDMKYLKQLLIKLNIGLISIDQNEAYFIINIEHGSTSKRSNHKKRRVIKEFSERENHINLGGTRGKIVTAYKEKVIRIALMLQKMKSASPKKLMEHTGIEETSRILQSNFDGWFEKVDRGIYQLSLKGEKELAHYLEGLDIQ
jgi:hypothetical protein